MPSTVEDPHQSGAVHKAGFGTTPVVEATGVSYTYAGGRKQESRRIGPLDLAVCAGERIAVIGPNGCGKSTLINLLSGAFTPDGGIIRWFGGDLTYAAKRRIGVVFQSPSLDALLTVQETLRLAGRMLQMTTKAIERRTTELADQLGVVDRLHSRVGTLSGGLARRVDLARAVMHGPSLLLLDEPTAGLDDESAAAFNNMVDVLARSGVAVVAATHTLQEVRLSQRVVVMVSGCIATNESVHDAHAAGPATTVTITGDTPALAEALGVHGVLPTDDGEWHVDLANMSDTSVASALRAALEAGGRIRTSERSMHGYFAQAERKQAAALQQEAGGNT